MRNLQRGCGATVAVVLVAITLAGCSSPSPLPPGASYLVLETSEGDVLVRLHAEQVPRLVAQVRQWVDQGVYSGLTVAADGPTLRIATATSMAVPDELHAGLRHDRAGVVSLAQAGPGQVASSLVVTTAAAPQLDDRHSVVGEVVEGLGALQALANGGTVDAARHAQEPGETTPTRGVSVVALEQDKATQGTRSLAFAFAVRNTGSHEDTLRLRATGPEGWNVTVDNPSLRLGSGQGAVAIVTAQPSTAGGSGVVTLWAESSAEPAAKAEARALARVGGLGPPVQVGDRVRVDYTVLLPDGRVVETTLAAIDANPNHTKVAGYATQPGSRQATVGESVPPALDALALASRLGESRVARLDAALGYGSDSPWHGRALVVELRIVALE